MAYKNAADVLPSDLLRRVQKFHVGMLWAPKTEQGFHEGRNANIIRLKENGYTITQIAEKIGLSVRQV